MMQDSELSRPPMKPRLSLQAIWPSISWKPKSDGTIQAFCATLIATPSAWGMHIMFLIEVLNLAFGTRYFAKTILPGGTSSLTVAIFALTYILILSCGGFLYIRAQETEYQCSAATIIRWFFFSMFCMEIFLFGMSVGKTDPIYWAPATIVPLALSVFFSALPGTTYERVMRFFGVNPAANNSANPYTLCWWEQLLWGLRVICCAFFFGCTNGYLQFKVIPNGLEKGSVQDKFIIAFVGAGFHEEIFKVLLLGTMTLIPKWKRNPEAILVPAVLASVGFAYLEMPQYLMTVEVLSGRQTNVMIVGGIMRGLCILLHALFTFPVAIAISRQRGRYSHRWMLEMFGAFAFSVCSHGLYDVLLFIEGWWSLLSRFFLLFGAFPLAVQLLRKFCPRQPTPMVSAQPHAPMMDMGSADPTAQVMYLTGTQFEQPNHEKSSEQVVML